MVLENGWPMGEMVKKSRYPLSKIAANIMQ